ncbi:MAG: hypothetical protein EBE86_019775 [Hormoscilla sp. GUM202]|nr:hypothetical protein [Hormoscilla sp. GUM202]
MKVKILVIIVLLNLIASSDAIAPLPGKQKVTPGKPLHAPGPGAWAS